MGGGKVGITRGLGLEEITDVRDIPDDGGSYPAAGIPQHDGVAKVEPKNAAGSVRQSATQPAHRPDDGGRITGSSTGAPGMA
jgi:hypothetical protein